MTARPDVERVGVMLAAAPPAGPWRLSLHQHATAPTYGVVRPGAPGCGRYIPVGEDEAEALAVRDVLNRLAAERAQAIGAAGVKPTPPTNTPTAS